MKGLNGTVEGGPRNVVTSVDVGGLCVRATARLMSIFALLGSTITGNNGRGVLAKTRHDGAL